MSMGTHGAGYIDGVFIHQGSPYGLEFSKGAREVGFTDANDPRQRQLFLERRRPDTGGPLLRHQSNSNAAFYDRLYSLDGTVNVWSMTQTLADQKRIAQIMKDAAALGESLVDEQLLVRTGPGGKDAEPCRQVSLLAVHPFNRKGEAAWHVHVVSQRAGVTRGGGRTYSFKDGRVLYRADAQAQLAFHLFVARELERQFHLRIDFVGGKAVLPGVAREQVLKASTRRADALQYLAARNINPTPPALALAVVNTRPKRRKFDHQERQRAWREEAKRDSPGVEERVKRGPGEPPSGFFARALEEFLVQPWKTLLTAARAALVKRHGVVKVRADAAAFLQDVQKRPRAEAHRAARMAVRRQRHESLWAALRFAERAYREARRPSLVLEPGTRVVVSEKAGLTQEQRDQFKRLAGKHGWVLRMDGKDQKPDPDQRQQQQNRRRY